MTTTHSTKDRFILQVNSLEDIISTDDICMINIMILDYLKADVKPFDYRGDFSIRLFDNWIIHLDKLEVLRDSDVVQNHYFKNLSLLEIIHNNKDLSQDVNPTQVKDIFKYHEYIECTIRIAFLTDEAPLAPISKVFSKRFLLLLMKIRESHMKVDESYAKEGWNIAEEIDNQEKDKDKDKDKDQTKDHISKILFKSQPKVIEPRWNVAYNKGDDEYNEFYLYNEKATQLEKLDNPINLEPSEDVGLLRTVDDN
jgi:hypothetical protein